MVVFDTANSTQTYTVPDGVQQLQIDVKGAGGGSGTDERYGGDGGSGGVGGRVQGVLTVQPDDTLTVEIAASGSDGDGDTGGRGGASPDAAGGDGGAGNSSGGGGGGGGATVLSKNGTVVAVAGGGGGGGGGTPDAGNRGGGGGGGGGRGGAGGSTDQYTGGEPGGSGEGSGDSGGHGGVGRDRNRDGGDGSDGDGVVVTGGSLASSSTATGGGNTSGGTVEITAYAPVPAIPACRADRLELSIAEGAAFDYYEVELRRDGGAWVAPAGGPSTPASRGSYSYTPASDAAYGRQVGVDSSFELRVRGVRSDGSSSSWSYSKTAYTTPVPPHNPSVSRPDGDTVKVSYSVKADQATTTTVFYRKDSGSGYGSWTYVGDTDEHGRSATGDHRVQTFSTSGNSWMDADSRYQFKIRHENKDASSRLDTGFVYADYGNEGNVYFEDNFETGDFSNWDTPSLTDSASSIISGAPPGGDSGLSGADEGTYYAHLESGDSVVKTLGDLSSESDVIVKCAMAAGSMDNSGENVSIDWYDGSTWRTLHALYHEYNKQGWVDVSARVPPEWVSSDNRLRLSGYGGSGDYGEWDRVVVSDILHEYTTPAAPSNLSVDAPARHTVSADWTTNATIFPPSFMEVRVRASGSGSLRDKYRIDYPRSTAEFGGNAGFDETVPVRDGEQYDVRLDALIRQFRRGNTDAWWRSTSSEKTVVTPLPAPTDHTYTSVTAVGAAHAWTSNHNYGTTTLQARHDGGDWEDVVTGLDHADETYTITSLLNGDQYDVRAVAVTEHTQTKEVE